jgi:hypothetical protein
MKPTILKKLNMYFTQQKFILKKFNENTFEFILNWIPFMKIVDEFKQKIFVFFQFYS